MYWTYDWYGTRMWFVRVSKLAAQADADGARAGLFSHCKSLPR